VIAPNVFDNGFLKKYAPLPKSLITSFAAVCLEAHKMSNDPRLQTRGLIFKIFDFKNGIPWAFLGIDSVFFDIFCWGPDSQRGCPETSQ